MRLKLKKQSLEFLQKVSSEEFEKQKNGFTEAKVEELTHSDLFRETLSNKKIHPKKSGHPVVRDEDY